MVTRRDVLRAGLCGGASALWGCDAADLAQRPSPPTTPFIADLPIPPPPLAVPPFASSACQDLLGKKTQFYTLVEEERLVQVHPELRPTRIWGYRDAAVASWPLGPGPTFHAQMAKGPGQGLVVRFLNQLPANHQGFGVPRTTVHLHGGHQPAHADGYPTLEFGPGSSFDYCYPLRVPGFTTPHPLYGDIPSTLWYHDHLLDFTGPNVYRGLAGFFLVFDDLDTGKETTGLRLPSGDFDVPLILQDQRFAADGSLVFDVFNHEGFLGDKFLVNGAIQPRLRVKRRKYRFRILDAGNARFYQLYLTNAAGQTFSFDQIATEAGLLAAPIRGLHFFRFAPSNRVEIIIDFSRFSPGTEVFLENRLQQNDGRRPGDVLPAGPKLLKFIVEDAVADTSQVPDQLRPFAPIAKSVLAAASRKTFEFNRTDGAWAINGALAGNLAVPITNAALNGPELWHLANQAGGWAHPIHIHLDFLRVIARNGQPPPLAERDGMARKDTVILGPNEDVDVFVEFHDFPGSYGFHCHNLEHEDLAMMARFDVI